MKTRVESDDLRLEGLDVENIDLDAVDLRTDSVTLDAVDLDVGKVTPPMRIEQDKVDPTLWNLLDYTGKCHGSVPVPEEIHVISAVFDATLGEIYFKYNKPSGEKDGFSLSLKEALEFSAGRGLEMLEGKLGIKIDKTSHKALSVSDDGLKFDGEYAFNTERYSDIEYKDF